MTFADPVYGRYTISSPALKDIIEAPEFQRLKHISQFGIPDELYHIKNFYRYEHCIGTMILLERLGADEEEQIAGLLHDVSHTAFSHIIDWVIGEGSGSDETHQDEQHQRFVATSEIKKILAHHGLDPERIANHDLFPLLEQPAPNLCADRVDYTLREISETTARKLLPHFVAHEKKIVMDSHDAALLFATEYLKLQEEHWAGFEAVSRYKLFSKALKRALNNNIIHRDDFWKNEDCIVQKLKQADDEHIKKILKTLKNKSLDHLDKEEEATHKKFRYVDPEFLQDDTLVRLSDANNTFAELLEAARERNAKGWHAVKLVLS